MSAFPITNFTQTGQEINANKQQTGKKFTHAFPPAIAGILTTSYKEVLYRIS
jgi:hypothetical protein